MQTLDLLLFLLATNAPVHEIPVLLVDGALIEYVGMIKDDARDLQGVLSGVGLHLLDRLRVVLGESGTGERHWKCVTPATCRSNLPCISS